MTVAHLLIQVALLTALLELSGGPSNAFTVIYAVQIALAAVTLGAGWAAIVGGWAALCYGLLIFWHLEELVPAHHRLIDFPDAAVRDVAGDLDSCRARPPFHRGRIACRRPP